MALHLIASATASGSATLEFTSGITSRFNEYQFYYVNMHPASEDGDDRQFMFQVNADGESGFNETMTTTYIDIYHAENDTGDSFGSNGSRYQADGTNPGVYQQLMYGCGADNDQSSSGVLTLYEPSSTTYVKHFVAVTQGSYYADYSMNSMVAGYISTTSEKAITEISFKMSSGNIDTGTIYMYGVGH